MAKTVKHPRMGKAEAARTLHVHHCTVCGRAFQRRNMTCAPCRPLACAGCIYRAEREALRMR